MPNESPNDPSELPPPLPGQVPPPLPGAEAPPPLPGVGSAPPQEVPVAKPVARAVPIPAEPGADRPKAAEPKPVPTVLSSPAPRVNEVEHEHARPQLKVALLVIGGMLLFGCCGISVLGVIFYNLTASVVKIAKDDIPNIPPPKMAPAEFKNAGNQKSAPARPPIEPAEKPPVEPPKPPVKETQAPTKTDPLLPKLTVPSPQGMDGLQAYVSFDNKPLREDMSRNKLTVNQEVMQFDGARAKACRLFVTPAGDGETPKFVVDFSEYLESLTYKDDSPFTISLWVRQANGEGVAFALMQNSIELGPKLLIKSTSRQIDVELYCDKNDSEKKFYRTKTNLSPQVPRGLHHVALTREKNGTLAVYVDSELLKDAPTDSLPAKQPVNLAFKQAGFAMRTAKLSTIELDEFSLFDRCLNADEIKTLSGRGKK